jgi:hypothetical protein
LSSSTKCATSSSPSTAPTFRTCHDNNDNPRRPSRWSSQTTSCHCDRLYQLKTGPSAPFSLFNPQQSVVRRSLPLRPSSTSPKHRQKNYGSTMALTHMPRDLSTLTHGVARLWIRHPEPTGARRVTPLQEFQQIRGHPPPCLTRRIVNSRYWDAFSNPPSVRRRKSSATALG